MLNTQLTKLDDRAKVLNDLKKAAAEMNIPVKTSELVGKDGEVPDLGAMSGPGVAAFSLAKGAISGPINAGRVGVVLSVTEKQEPSAEDIAKNFAQFYCANLHNKPAQFAGTQNPTDNVNGRTRVLGVIATNDPENQGAINGILLSFGIPLLDENDHPIGMEAAAKRP